MQRASQRKSEYDMLVDAGASPAAGRMEIYIIIVSDEHIQEDD